MTADSPVLDTVEAEQFARAWMDLTDVGHITLMAAPADRGATKTRTFTASVLDTMGGWISGYQADGMNVYFQANATHLGCNKKPSKEEMVHAVCRHGDVDPDDDNHGYKEERDRLHKLGEFMWSDPTMPPTVLIDSGNGIYPIFVVTKQELLTPALVEAIEVENRQIEGAVGAAGTHNIDRLLRLPGTVNYPNELKRKRGRGIARARLLHCGTRTYSPAEAALIGPHWQTRLAGSDLVRKPASGTGKAEKKTAGGKRDMFGNDNSRSIAAFRKGCQIRREGKTFEEMCQALADDPETAEWTKEKGEPKDKRELRRIWDKAGILDADVNAVIEEFNRRYLVVNEGGKAIVYAPGFNAILHRKFYDRISFDDLKRLYLNRAVKIAIDSKGNPVLRNAATVWLEHPQRKQYLDGVVFDPSGAAAGNVLNLWHGFAVKATKGDWSRMRAHILDVICCGDTDRFDYLVRWLARMVQHPDKPGEVAVVLKGGEGTGKGTLAKALLRIMGQHGLAISNAKHLTGNFNGHLRDAVFLFADEAFYAGDKQHVGVLKALITESFLTIEGKHQTAVQTPNFMHVLMASNEDWVVPAALDARRFFVLEISETHKGDHAYFAALWAQMDAGGYAAMLHDLLAMDLTGFNVRAVPVTDGLQTQRKLSLPIPELWWQDVLHRGFVYQSKHGLGAFFCQWRSDVATELLFASYSDFSSRKHDRHQMSRETFGRFMIRMGAKPKRLLNAAVGEHVIDVPNNFGSTSRKATTQIAARPCGYTLGDLKGERGAREAFGNATGLKVDWGDLPDAAADPAGMPDWGSE